MSSAAAEWFVRIDADWGTKALYGPPGFEAYARVPYDMSGERADVAVMRSVLDVLAPYTSTPELVHLGIWVGWGFSDHEPVGELFELPHRGYVHVTSTLESALEPSTLQVSSGSDGATPHLLWPDDRSWFVASDVDPEWFAVGASRAAIDALIAAPGCGAVRSEYGSHREIEW